MININNICRLTQEGSETTIQDLKEPLEIHAGAGERVELDILAMRGRIAATIMLEGNGASCAVKCAYLAAEQDRVDLDLQIIHRAGGTTACQIVKGIATDSAQVSFAGVIRIPADSQKCDSAQNHRGIVLTQQARIAAVPELEIYADDVKCAHGSAIGPLDQKQIFYLQARGIPEEEAKSILLHAFVKDALAESFEQIAEEWMDKHAER